MESFSVRTRLAPGLRVVRRGPHHLQVGLYADRRVLLPRTPVVERTLRALLGQGPLDCDPETADPEAADPDPGACRETQEVLHLLARGHCLAATGGSGTVAVVGRLDGQLDGRGVPDAGSLLRSGGCTVLGSPGTGLSGPRADVVLLLSAGELARETVDGLVRQQTSHLVVRLVDGGAVLGPFVVPGATACLRCIDAHESLRDPDHVAVTTRYVRATARGRCDGVPDTDPTTAALVVSWAVRDVLAHLAGTEPSTWSRTLHLGPQPAAARFQEWQRHPQCGCSWPPDLPSSRVQPPPPTGRPT